VLTLGFSLLVAILFSFWVVLLFPSAAVCWAPALVRRLFFPFSALPGVAGAALRNCAHGPFFFTVQFILESLFLSPILFFKFCKRWPPLSAEGEGVFVFFPFFFLSSAFRY